MTAIERDTVTFSAFMFAGATRPNDAPELCERFGGQLGFACKLVPHVLAVVTVLSRAYSRRGFNPDYPGVLEYELLEPLGEWLIRESQHGFVQPRDTAARFLRQFRQWVRD